MADHFRFDDEQLVELCGVVGPEHVARFGNGHAWAKMSRFVEGLGEHRHATEPFVLEVLPDAGRLDVRRGGGEDDEPDRDVSGSGRGQMLA